MSDKKGKLVILSAPSGAGKTTICKNLLNMNKEWLYSISATTRPIRENETDGKAYHFLTKEKFEHKEKFGEFIECEWVHGNRYGTPVQPLEDALDNGSVFLLDIDVKGAINLIEDFGEQCLSVFIEPPGINIQEKLESLNERLLKRGGSNETLIKQRLKRFELELSYKEKIKLILPSSLSFINEDLEETTNEINKKIKENLR
jgi:guanylate kinase